MQCAGHAFHLLSIFHLNLEGTFADVAIACGAKAVVGVEYAGESARAPFLRWWERQQPRKPIFCQFGRW